MRHIVLLFHGRCALPPQARTLLLTNLKTHLIIRVSKHLTELLKGLQGRGIEFISLTEQIDTTTPGGKLIFHLMGALAEFERDLIRERTNAGLAAAKARGRVGGRPRKLKTNGKVALAWRMFADQSHSLPEICAALGISRATLYRYVKEAESPA